MKRFRAEGEGFEPSDGGNPSAVFKTAIKDAQPPRGKMVALTYIGWLRHWLRYGKLSLLVS